MQRRTTTKQLYNTLSNNLLSVERAEMYNKTTRQTDEISIDSFKDSLEFLSETIFSDAIGWFYEKDFKTGNYEFDCGRMNPNTDLIIIAHLCANDEVNAEDIERILKTEED